MTQRPLDAASSDRTLIMRSGRPARLRREAATKPRVMVVDDRPSNRRIMKELAAGLGDGVDVVAFGDPLKALEAARAVPPDLVISDYKMPMMDGAEFVTALRRLPACVDIPIVIVTIYEDKDLRYRALQAGATDFLLSPIDHQEFRIRMENLLLMRRQQRIIRNHALSLERKLVIESESFVANIRELEGRLHQVIDSVQAMISVTDLNHRYIYVNRAWCACYGLPASAVVGERPEQNAPAAAQQRILAAALAGDPAGVDAARLDPEVFEEEVETVEGRQKVLLTSHTPLRGEGGGITGLITVSVDITSRKRAERELLNAMWRAQASERAKGAFLAQMSHDLRTPLNAILGFSEVMIKEIFGALQPSRYRGYALDINRSAKKLLETISDILARADDEVPQPDLIDELIQIDQAMLRTVQVFRERRRSSARILFHVTSKLPLIRGDLGLIERVFLGLLNELAQWGGEAYALVISVGVPFEPHAAAGRDPASDERDQAEVSILATPESTLHSATGPVPGTLPDLRLVTTLAGLQDIEIAMDRVGEAAIRIRAVLPARRQEGPRPLGPVIGPEIGPGPNQAP